MDNMKTQSTLRIFGGLLLAGALTTGLVAQSAASRNDQPIQQKVTQVMAEKSQFKEVRASVEDGIVTLNGTVPLYQDKLDAARKAHKIANVQGVKNLLTVAGNSVPDTQLQEKLSKKLAYERVGYPDNAFNYFTLKVQDGVVTLGGEAYNPVAKDMALATIQRTAGVKDVEDQVKVARVSIVDDDVRAKAAQVIYRDPVLGKYATDPARPIRIVVDGGHIRLYGVVDSAMDKQVAGMRVGSVPGAFSVQNNLTVGESGSAGM
jgi:osmotically-inducible protein OsmY